MLRGSDLRSPWPAGRTDRRLLGKLDRMARRFVGLGYMVRRFARRFARSIDSRDRDFAGFACTARRFAESVDLPWSAVGDNFLHKSSNAVVFGIGYRISFDLGRHLRMEH